MSNKSTQMKLILTTEIKTNEYSQCRAQIPEGVDNFPPAMAILKPKDII